MFSTRTTLGEAAAHPLLQPIAADFVKNLDLTPLYGLTFAQLYEKQGLDPASVIPGLNALVTAMKNGGRLNLYTAEEIAVDPVLAGVYMIRFLSVRPEADRRPYVLVCPGGGMYNVWNLSEGYPIAAELNRLGYHALVLTYRVAQPKNQLLALQDVDRALSFLRDHPDVLPVPWARYITAGFSAGGQLITSWGTDNRGFAAFGKPAPKAMFPVYAFISWRITFDTEEDRAYAPACLGLSDTEAAGSDWNAEEHVSSYPPCYIVCTTDDELVPAESSRALKRALDRAGIPAVLEEKPHGGHGFAEGLRADTRGWLARAVAFAESL